MGTDEEERRRRGEGATRKIPMTVMSNIARPLRVTPLRVAASGCLRVAPRPCAFRNVASCGAF